MLDHTFLARPDPQIVLPGSAKAKPGIGAAPDNIGIIIILAIILPIAHFTDVRFATHSESCTSATGTAKGQIGGLMEPSDVLLVPGEAAGTVLGRRDVSRIFVHDLRVGAVTHLVVTAGDSPAPLQR